MLGCILFNNFLEFLGIHSIYYSSVLPLPIPIPKNYHKECSLNFDNVLSVLRRNSKAAVKLPHIIG